MATDPGEPVSEACIIAFGSKGGEGATIFFTFILVGFEGINFSSSISFSIRVGTVVFCCI